VISSLSVSLDGYIAGPDDGPEHPLGRGGERLFDWYSAGDTDYVMRAACSTRSRSTWCRSCSAAASACSRRGGGTPVSLQRTQTIEGTGVTHLRFRVLR
jgi:hypothetical protein